MFRFISRRFFSQNRVSQRFNVRPASVGDYREVLEMSEGLYDGYDYLPLVFHRWLQEQNRLVFVAHLGSKLVGLQSVVFIDGGATSFYEAMRIHPNYRGQGLASRLITYVNEYVNKNKPGTLQRERYITVPATVARLPAKRESDRQLCQLSFLTFPIKEKLQIESLDNIGRPMDLIKPCSKQELLDTVFAVGKAGVLFPEKSIIFDWKPFDAMIPANWNQILKDGTYLLLGDSTQENGLQESFSLGRASELLKCSFWATTIRTSNPVLFKAHLGHQLKIACEFFDGKNFELHLSCNEEFASLGKSFLLEDMNIEHDHEDLILLFERNLYAV